MFLLLFCSLFVVNLAVDADDWDCNVGRANTAGRYGDLGGGLTQIISGSNTDSSYCASTDDFTVSGSSTVYPLMKIWAIEFLECGSNELNQMGCSDITLSAGGSGQGAEDVCDGDSEVGDMSRDFKLGTEAFEYRTETFTHGCLDGNGRTLSQIPVALDGITVFVQSGSELAQCLSDKGGLTYGELRWIYSELADGQLDYVPTNSSGTSGRRTWKELYNSCPDEEIGIYGADEISGTYDFFSEEIFTTDSFSIARGYVGYADDDDITESVFNDANGIGYMGYSHYARNTDKLIAIDISGSLTTGGMLTDAVTPTQDTINGDYPIARTIYVNVENSAFAENDAIYQLLVFGFSDMGQELLVNQTGYVSLPNRQFLLSQNTIEMRGALSSSYEYYGSLGGSEDNIYMAGDDDNCVTYHEFNISGSSTVYPVAKVWLYHFIEWQHQQGSCIIAYLSDGGSSRGARQVCKSIVDIGDMSRDWKSTEAYPLDDGYTYQCGSDLSPICIRVTQIELGIDGITVFAQKDSDLADCIEDIGGLTYEQLNSIVTAEDSSTWRDILGNGCPNTAIQLYLPGEDSGTLAFFCEELGIEDDNCKENYFIDNTIFSEDDDDLTTGVVSDSSALGVAGYAHYSRYMDVLYAIPLDEDDDEDWVTPTADTIDDESYPMARKIYMNIRKDSQDNIAIRRFLNFGLNTNSGELLLRDFVGYVNLDDDTVQEMVDRIGGNDVYWNRGQSCNLETTVEPGTPTKSPVTTPPPTTEKEQESNQESEIKDNKDDIDDLEDDLQTLTLAFIILIVVLFVCICVVCAFLGYKERASKGKYQNVETDGGNEMGTRN